MREDAVAASAMTSQMSRARADQFFGPPSPAFAARRPPVRPLRPAARRPRLSHAREEAAADGKSPIFLDHHDTYPRS